MPLRPGRSSPSSKKHAHNELGQSRSQKQLFLPSTFLRPSAPPGRRRHHSHKYSHSQRHQNLPNNSIINGPPRRTHSPRNERPYSRRAIRCSSISDISNPPGTSSAPPLVPILPPPPSPPVPVPASPRRACHHRTDFWSVVVGPTCTCASAHQPLALPSHSVPPPAVHECHICGMKFTQVGSRNTHVRVVHHNIRPFQCTEPGCGRAFGQRGDLTRHFQSVHERQKQYACVECGFKFSRKSALCRHVRAKHN